MPHARCTTEYHSSRGFTCYFNSKQQQQENVGAEVFMSVVAAFLLFLAASTFAADTVFSVSAVSCSRSRIVLQNVRRLFIVSDILL